MIILSRWRRLSAAVLASATLAAAPPPLELVNQADTLLFATLPGLRACRVQMFGPDGRQVAPGSFVTGVLTLPKNHRLRILPPERGGDEILHNFGLALPHTPAIRFAPPAEAVEATLPLGPFRVRREYPDGLHCRFSLFNGPAPEAEQGGATEAAALPLPEAGPAAARFKRLAIAAAQKRHEANVAAHQAKRAAAAAEFELAQAANAEAATAQEAADRLTLEARRATREVVNAGTLHLAARRMQAQPAAAAVYAQPGAAAPEHAQVQPAPNRAPRKRKAEAAIERLEVFITRPDAPPRLGACETLAAQLPSNEPGDQFQWLHNGLPLDEANGPTLQRASLAPEHLGEYQVIVTRDGVEYESPVLALSVTEAPL